ncbi:DUF721 domain-containing protein [Providencia alcalifaciens]|uniref:DUF721 domain-containing protein n=1 Tax=Providencia alcalifaciens DSM 30120 TaxID=520999 RepID=B6XKF1_9GAMM|nr:DciA family protein [Providencia alcalifaciens]ATG16618.1 DUF721 domain-containing protein [Providencia alcalifaciens]EEB44208.1 hypothetical protein PROVALCAL_03861 [Providencia alcalifaciens DSM 30120]MTC27865.1 DUF721 domain-containing protein [Providencia alcalifaciens]MTC52142.1 DUF721 domain-containing protein [Providencia alcalifaciens]SPY72810.1 Zn-ribbon-containing, possibly RNA-binding protein and truncated derivatives [Providencia alcalifaciens]
MRDSHPQALFDVLEESLAKTSNTLQTIQRNAKAILKLNRVVKSLLPAEIKPMCRVANYRNNIMVIEVANASWMTRLNYERTNLLSALRSSILPSLSSIDIRINPDLIRKSKQNSSLNKQSVNQRENRNQRQISTQTAEQLLRLAEKSPKGLKERFERLAALAGESTNATNRKG